MITAANTIKVKDPKDIPLDLRIDACSYTLYEVIMNYTTKLGEIKKINAKYVFNIRYCSGTWAGYIGNKEIELKYLPGFHGDLNNFEAFSKYLTTNKESTIKRSLTSYVKQQNNESQIDNIHFIFKLLEHVIGYPHFEKPVKQVSFFDPDFVAQPKKKIEPSENNSANNQKIDKVTQIVLF